MEPSSSSRKPFLLERIIEASARNLFLVFILVVFGVTGGVWALMRTPLDAIPDLSDVQVIVYTDWEGRSPDLVEDQITYPISTKFIAAPKVKFVRGESMFGKSFIYVIFQDGTDIYWARSRVIEYLNSVRGMLPEGVNPVIGPDATGVGWVYEYALVDKTGKHNLADLRSFQDWHLRYALESVKGVSEVAPVGGFVKEYQVDLDPNKLAAYGIPMSEVVNKIRMSNGDVGGKIFEVGSTEYYVRGRGYIKSIADIENVPLKTRNGTPVFVKNVGTVHLGPDIRRGVAELNGEGEVVGGIVVMRYGENALTVIDGIKKKLEEIKSSLPEGVELVTTYDRSQLIKRSISTLREKLIEESIVVALVCLVFLWHIRSALVAIITLPIAILLSFLPMYWMGLTSNIMSLGGIAIAIGAMVDSAIAGAGADAAVCAWQNHARGKKSHQPLPDLGVSTVRPFRASLSLAHVDHRAAHHGRDDLSVQETWQGVHAAAERRRHSVHAYRRPRHDGHRGDQSFTSPGPDAARISRS
jgi:Cu(I)/Ag(I) efflux system membrane protein CusA/SilA